MPKGSRRKNGGGQDRIIKQHGHFVYTVSTAATVSPFFVNPLYMDQRLIEQSDEFQEYRFTSLKARAFSEYTTTLHPVVSLAYTPVVLGTFPTVAQLPSLAVFALGAGSAGFPFPSIRVPRSELQSNAPKWFRRGTAYDDLLETQGTLYVGTTSSFATLSVVVHIEYTVELKARAEAGLTALFAQRTPTQSIAQTLNMVPNPRAALRTEPATELKQGMAGTTQAALQTSAQTGTRAERLGQTGEAGGSRQPPVDVTEAPGEEVWIRISDGAKRPSQAVRDRTP